MNRILNIFIFVFITVNTITVNIAGKNTCTKIKIPPTNISQPDIDQIVRFLDAELSDLPKGFQNIAQAQMSNFDDIFAPKSEDVDEDAELSITRLIQKYGFDTQVHEVTTEDGYVLKIHRIPGKGKPVFLMHGLFFSADDWITNGPHNSLALYLAEHGYDVWIGNARGTKHSRKNKNILPKCTEFWDFSWHEIGLYDLPAMIDHVLDTTDEKKIPYIGHSQGTTSAFVLCSERPDYNKKFEIIVALSPIAWMSHLKSPLLRILSLNNGFYYTIYGSHEFVGENSILTKILKMLTGENPFGKLIASNGISILCGFSKRINIKYLPSIMKHTISSISMKQLIHYGQNIESAEFRQFDYGTKKNEEVYGCRDPPSYQMENVTALVALFYSDADWLSNTKDVDILKKRLPNRTLHFMKGYAHTDYVWAKDMAEQLSPKILDLISN